jgi:hypothetical protein
LLLLFGFGTYLFFSLAHLSLPGLQYDEVLFTNAALGDVDGTFIAWKVRILRKSVPLMLMNYIGAVKALIYAPIFRFIGMSAVTARLPVVLLGLATLILTYALIRRMMGARTALVTLILLAADPSFIFSVKLDWGPVALMMALKASSLYLLWRWLETGKQRYLVAGSFLLGLGLYDKIIFSWFVIGLLIALLCCFWRELRSRIDLRAAVLSASLFAIGCLPLLAYNLAHRMQTFQGHGLSFVRGGESLAYRFRLFRTVFDGSAVYDFVNGADVGDITALRQQSAPNGLDAFNAALAGFPLLSTIMPQMLVLASIVLLLLWLSKRLAPARVLLFFIIQFAITAAFIYLSDDAEGPHHTIMVYPIPHILIACGLVELIRLGEAGAQLRKKVLTIFSGLCIIALVASQVIIDARYVWSFQARGGVGFWSDAIYDLARYTRSQPDKTYLLMDWGFSNQLLLLSGSKIKKREAYFPTRSASDSEKIAWLRPYLRLQNSILVFHAPAFESFPMLKCFQRALQQQGLMASLVKTFYQRDGTAIYYLYEIWHPELNSYFRKGGFFYFREAEDWDLRAGGDIDLKQGASQGRALGNFWGRRQSDFALYRFLLPRELSDVHIFFRYAFEGASFQQYNIFIDGNRVTTLALPATRGYGYTEQEWLLYGIKLGSLSPGTHELKIAPALNDQVVNLDYFYLCEGEFWLDSPAVPR